MCRIGRFRDMPCQKGNDLQSTQTYRDDYLMYDEKREGDMEDEG